MLRRNRLSASELTRGRVCPEFATKLTLVVGKNKHLAGTATTQ
jgi:hypothetical protein